MKEIKAYIRPEKVVDVISSLENNGIDGMTVINVSMLGKWVDEKNSTLSIDFCQKYCQSVKIELICDDEDTDKFVDIITKNAKTGRKCDGNVFVSDIEKAVSIRTGETGSNAI